VPDLALDVFGDGPQHDLVREAAGDVDWVQLHGVVEAEAVADALAGAACLVLPSAREGYGLVVVEALAVGCPAVVVDDPDNAAVELVEEGVNGAIAASGAPVELGAAIVRAVRGGEALRRSTARWYAAHAKDLSLETSMAVVVASYATSRRRGDP
jgi:glycosyltransferase involved in cell wall biosynthesis